MTELKTEWIDQWEGLRPLRDEWNALLQRSRANTIFLAWERVTAWAEAVGASSRPFVLTVRDGEGALVGVAPFYAASFRLLGVVPVRALRMAGDQAGAAEYLDWIVREDLEEPVYGAIAAALAAHAPPWDFIWMPYVATWKGTGTRVLEACRRHGLTTRERPQAFAVVDLPAEYSRYLASLSGNARSAVKRQTREFAERGLTFEECRTGEELPEYLERLFELNHLRWRERGRRGIVEKPALMRFYRQFAPVALARGWLRLFAARLGREIMAIQYGYVYGGAFHQVTEGFDPRVASGVGTALRARVIETCIKEGLSAYDFLAGYTDHKRRWGAAMRFGSDLLIGNRRSRGAFCAGVGIWPTGRYLRASALPT